MIEKIGPTIYNGGTIYNIGGGGGGGGGGGDIPADISLYMKLKETVNARFSQTDLNQFPIKDTDIVNIVLELNLKQTSSGVYAGILCLNTQPLSGQSNEKNLICLSYSGTNNSFIFDKSGYANMYFSNVGDNFYLLSSTMYENDMTVKFNGETKAANRNVQINNDLAITQIWPRADGGFKSNALFYLYGLTVKTNDGVLKYDFCPALNTDTNKIGLFEKVNGIFISGNDNNNFELIGEL
jgi:hypothetical protein